MNHQAGGAGGSLQESLLDKRGNVVGCPTPTPILYHIVFSTKDRRPFITPEYEFILHDYIGGL